MLTVKYEEYLDDNHRKNHVAEFENLQALEDWMFDQMQQDYQSQKGRVMHFPKSTSSELSRISFTPVFGDAEFWIYLIEGPNGIMFSEGTFTCNKTHASKQVRDWLAHCIERRDNPQFCFAED